MDNKEKDIPRAILYCGIAFAAVTTGVLVCCHVPNALAQAKATKAQAFKDMADGYRQLSLAKKYDADATAKQLESVYKTVMKRA